MSYLYGDSTPAALDINYIDFLRDAVDCAVQIVAADQHLREGVTQTEARRTATETEIERLEALGGVVSRAIENAPKVEAETPTARCADSIVRSANELVQAEIERARANLRVEEERIAVQAVRERQSCVTALGALLLKHDLPAWSAELHLAQQGGTRYSARLDARAPFGLEVTLDLEIAASHLFSHAVRVDKLIERLEVQAPEAGGWLRKEVKLRPQRLDKEYITELRLGESESTIKLRANPDGTGMGCDLMMRGSRALFVRAGEGDPTPFELADADAVRVLELRDKLADACAELRSARKELTDAKLDGAPLAEHDDPKKLAERLIETLAPTVQEIAKRSLSPTELVLKRQLDSGRREEIFVARTELEAKLAPLGERERALFAPLGLAPAASMPWKPSPSALLAPSEPPRSAIISSAPPPAEPPPPPPRQRRPSQEITMQAEPEDSGEHITSREILEATPAALAKR